MRYVKVRGANGMERGECRLCVSVGATIFEGEPLVALVDWMNSQSLFTKFHVVVADSLQRHNRPGDGTPSSESRREVEARNEGEAWLSRNEPLLRQLTIPTQHWRWDDFRLSFSFQANLSVLRELHKNDLGFREALETDVQYFLRRRERHGHTVYTSAYDSREYFLEELSCISVMIDRLPIPEVYPGPCFRAARYLKRATHIEPFAAFRTHRFLELIASDRHTERNADGRAATPGSAAPTRTTRKNLERDEGSIPSSEAREVFG